MNVNDYFIQELLSSSDSSSEEDVEPRGPMDLVPKIQQYVEQTVQNYSDEEFKKHFRISKDSFDRVLLLIQNEIATTAVVAGHHTIPAKTQLLLAIWYFATPDSYRSICSRFNIGKATGLRSVRRVANALCLQSSGIIKWPEGAELQETINGFQDKGFPDTTGAIDGTHINIPMPKNHGLSYINRHNRCSSILQGVCDHKLKFIHCYAGEAGACHDSRVLKRSEVWAKIVQFPDMYFPNNTHLIGDKAYPCLAQLQVPYRDNGHLTAAQNNFNYRLSSARTTIERAFALLKGRFRCLKFFELKKEEWIPKYVIACCVLHNICIDNNDFIEVQPLPQDDNVEGDNEPEGRQLLHMGQIKRDQICAELFMNRN